MNYSKYNRYSAILEGTELEPNILFKFQKDSRYKLRGYIKLETGNGKACISCSAENLKYYEKSDYLYKLILLGKKKSKVIFANGGTLILNRQGHGEAIYHFDPSNVDGDKSGLHDFSSIVIASISSVDAEEDMHPLLVCDLPKLSGSTKSPEILNVPAFFRSESEETEVTGNVSSRSTVKAARVPEPEAISQAYNRYYNDFIRTTCEHLYKVSPMYEMVSPFENDLQNIKWYKVLNIMNLPFINTAFHFASGDYFRSAKFIEGNIHASCQDMAGKYRHFLFGIKESQKKGQKNSVIQKYYFAIPGMYCKEEQPDGGRSGFRYWQPLNGGGHDKNTYGYWMAAIDAKTGDVEEITASE